MHACMHVFFRARVRTYACSGTCASAFTCNRLCVRARICAYDEQGEELSRAYAAADVFVMPSESETLGFVVLEAMASQVRASAGASVGADTRRCSAVCQINGVDDISAEPQALPEC